LAVSVLHLLLNIFLINGWLFDPKVELNHHKPTWFILLSGNFIIVIAFTTLFRPEEGSLLYEFSYLFYSVAIFLWTIFTSSLLYRLIFDTPIEVTLRPSLFIFLAPPSLGCSASLFMSDSFLQTGLVTEDFVGIITWFSFSFATVMLLVWLIGFRYFIKSGFTVAGWSYVYPLAAYGLAGQYLAEALSNSWLAIYSLIIFIVIVVLVSILFISLIKHVMSESNPT